MRLLIAAIVAYGMIAGCATRPQAPVAAQEAVLAQGAEVRLVLLDKLESGISAEGSPVRLMVVEDVRGVQGDVAIPAGTIATGVVAWSRRADPLRMIANQPARLAIELRSAAVGRVEVPLAPASPDERGRLVFTRSTVSPRISRDTLDKLMGDPEVVAAIERMASSFDEGRLAEATDLAHVRHAAQTLGLKDLTRALAPNELGEFEEALRSMRAAGTLAHPTSLTLGAILDLAALLGGAGDRLSRMLKAPNITAHVGTPVDAVVAAETTVEVDPPR
jgi:hypothetical protein